MSSGWFNTSEPAQTTEGLK